MNAVMSDGSVRFIFDNIELLTFNRVGNRQDRNPVELDDLALKKDIHQWRLCFA